MFSVIFMRPHVETVSGLVMDGLRDERRRGAALDVLMCLSPISLLLAICSSFVGSLPFPKLLLCCLKRIVLSRRFDLNF